MHFCQKILILYSLLLCLTLSMTGVVSAANNIEFLAKELITELNFGIYEVVTPKKENPDIEYARELPFDRLGFIERNEKFHSIGTAFFINDRELMTAAHVFSLEYFSLLQDFYIRSDDGKVYPVNMINHYSTLRDMAVFDLKEYPPSRHPLNFSSEVAIGDTVFSVGNAQGEGIAYRAGQIASFTPEREYGKWRDIRFTSPASPGNSGGPLLNLNGEVVGLIVKKNESENYNVSVPIDELKNLMDTAEFHKRNLSMGLSGVDDTLTRDWSFSMALPASLSKVAQLAQGSLDAHMRKMGDDLTEKVEDRNFPRGERYRSYLRNQSFIKGLALLLPDTNFNKWGVKSSFLSKIPITATQNVYRGRSYITDLQVIVEKPDNLGLKEFLDSPRVVMENVLQGVSFTRQVGEENVPVTSFGEPESSELVTDRLGRKWISSLWNLPHTDTFVYSSCLPYPKGVICYIDKKGSANWKYGYSDDLHDAYDETVIGYTGEIDDWIEFFSLDKTYLPTLFNNVELRLKDQTLWLQLKDFSIMFSSPKITNQSTLHFHLGYSNEQLLAEDILVFEIFPETGGKEQYRIQPFFEPSPFNSDSYTSRWNDVISGTGDYSGKAVNKGGMTTIKKAFESTRKTISVPDTVKIERIFTVGCTYKAGNMDVEDDCNAFSNSITFGSF